MSDEPPRPKSVLTVKKEVKFDPSIPETATASGTLSTKTKGKKLLVVHYGDLVKRIAFTETARAEAIERSIRRECGLEEVSSFSLLDGDGDSLVVDGSMEPSEVWLQEQEPINPKLKRAGATVRVKKPPPDFNPISLENAVRYTFDVDTASWSQATVQVKIDPDPFASGNLRKAHFMHDLADPGCMYVAKISIDPEEDRETYFQDVEMQMYAKKWAERFNLYSPPKKVDFVMASLIELVDRKGRPLMAVEKFIDGPYRKHNNNYGYVSEAERSTPQAFSHFTYEASKHTILICDIQGVGDLYTDPQMHTRENMPSLGKGNLGTRGFERFLATHQCNAICAYLKLPLINQKEKEKDIGTRPDRTFMSYQHIDVVNVEMFHNSRTPSISAADMMPKIPMEKQRLLISSQIQATTTTSPASPPPDRCCCTIL
jgi:hypothetical protein